MLGGHGVAFGPAFKNDDVRMHNADESMDNETHYSPSVNILYIASRQI